MLTKERGQAVGLPSVLNVVGLLFEFSVDFVEVVGDVEKYF